MKGSGIHREQVDMQNTGQRKLTELYKAGLDGPPECSNVAGGRPAGGALGPARTLFDGWLHFIQVIRLCPGEKVRVRIVRVIPEGETYCVSCIRVVSCTSVSRGADRDERDVSHSDEGADGLVTL